ncbi:MAG: AAA family ATPase [Phycisphaerales bacterium]|nr:AAA family ATPase [Phycisphaerales bacterium]
MNNLDRWIATIEEIDFLLPQCACTLERFYSPVHGFQANPEAGSTSAISHAICVEASLALDASAGLDYFSDAERVRQLDLLIQTKPTTGRNSTHPERPVVESSPYAASIVLPALSALSPWSKDLPDPLCRQLGLLLEQLNNGATAYATVEYTGAVDVRRQTPFRHALFLYRLRRAFAALEASWLKALCKAAGQGAQVGKLRKDLGRPIELLNTKLKDGLYYFLSMCDAIPNNEEDAAELGYCIYALHRYTNYRNDVVAEHASHLAANTLFKDGRVPRLQVALRDPIHNISVSPIEILTLLSVLPHTLRTFDRVASAYQRAYDWVRATQRAGLFSESDAPGWMAEPWRGEGKPEAWLNAGVIQFLVAYRALLRQVCAERVLVELRAVTAKPQHLWDDVIDFDRFKDELAIGFFDPILKALDRSDGLPKSSIILYGPPGTTKTSVAAAIAWKLRWPFVEIGPHLFAEDGVEGVIRKAKTVFRKLMVLERCVILLDEVDELVRSRDAEYEKIGRFITTSVLPWLQHLRNRARLVLIVATNHVERFDPAIRRPGRFDYVIPIGPPRRAERRERLKYFSRKAGIGDEKLATVVEDLDRAIETAWKTEWLKTKLEGDPPDHDIAWPATIGELKYLVEHAARAGASKETEALVNRAAQNPLISPSEWTRFEKDTIRYRYPPLTRDGY